MNEENQRVQNEKIPRQEGETKEKLPKTSEIPFGLNEKELRVVWAILMKKPRETWEKIAGELEISVRQLYTYRQSEKIKEACTTVAWQVLKTDLPAVLAALSEKACAGDVSAIKLYLGHIRAMEKVGPLSSIRDFMDNLRKGRYSERPDSETRKDDQ